MKKLSHLLFAGTFALLTACGDGSNDDASVRFVHLSPDAPNVDILLDGSVVLSDVAYPTASSYLDTEPTLTEVKVNAAGTSTSVIDADVTFEEDVSYTVIAANKLAAIEPIVLTDERGATPGGQVSLRVVHGAPSAPNVDVYVTAPDASLDSATPVLSNVPFKAASGYLVVDEGTYQVRVTVAGTKTVAIDTGAVELDGGTRLTAIARDNVGGGAPFSLLLLDDR